MAQTNQILAAGETQARMAESIGSSITQSINQWIGWKQNEPYRKQAEEYGLRIEQERQKNEFVGQMSREATDEVDFARRLNAGGIPAMAKSVLDNHYRPEQEIAEAEKVERAARREALEDTNKVLGLFGDRLEVAAEKGDTALYRDTHMRMRETIGGAEDGDYISEVFESYMDDPDELEAMTPEERGPRLAAMAQMVGEQRTRTQRLADAADKNPEKYIGALIFDQPPERAAAALEDAVENGMVPEAAAAAAMPFIERGEQGINAFAQHIAGMKLPEKSNRRGFTTQQFGDDLVAIGDDKSVEVLATRPPKPAGSLNPGQRQDIVEDAMDRVDDLEERFGEMRSMLDDPSGQPPAPEMLTEMEAANKDIGGLVSALGVPSANEIKVGDEVFMRTAFGDASSYRITDEQSLEQVMKGLNEGFLALIPEEMAVMLTRDYGSMMRGAQP